MKLFILAICIAAAYGEAHWDPNGQYKMIDDGEPAPKIIEEPLSKEAELPELKGAHWDPSGQYRIIADSAPVEKLSFDSIPIVHHDVPELADVSELHGAHWDPSGQYRIIADSPIQKLSYEPYEISPQYFELPKLSGLEGYRSIASVPVYPYPTYPIPTYPYPTYPTYPYPKPYVPVAAATREYKPFFYDYKQIKSGDIKP